AAGAAGRGGAGRGRVRAHARGWLAAAARADGVGAARGQGGGLGRLHPRAAAPGPRPARVTVAGTRHARGRARRRRLGRAAGLGTVARCICLRRALRPGRARALAVAPPRAAAGGRVHRDGLRRAHRRARRGGVSGRPLSRMAPRDRAARPSFRFQPVAFVRNALSSVSQIPKGAGAEHTAEGTIEFLPEFAAGLRDIEGFSHLYVLWVFDRAEGYTLLPTPPTADRPPGVFAPRAPRRPNPIGLTVVELLDRDGPRLRVKGLDMLDRTPVLDLKPYLSSVPLERVRRGWLEEAEQRR